MDRAKQQRHEDRAIETGGFMKKIITLRQHLVTLSISRQFLHGYVSPSWGSAFPRKTKSASENFDTTCSYRYIPASGYNSGLQMLLRQNPIEDFESSSRRTALCMSSPRDSEFTAGGAVQTPCLHAQAQPDSGVPFSKLGDLFHSQSSSYIVGRKPALPSGLPVRYARFEKGSRAKKEVIKEDQRQLWNCA